MCVYILSSNSTFLSSQKSAFTAVGWCSSLLALAPMSASVPGARTELQAVIMTQQSKLQVQSTWSSPTPRARAPRAPFCSSSYCAVRPFWLPLKVLSSWLSSWQLCLLQKERAIHVLSAWGLKNTETCWRMLGLLGLFEQRPTESLANWLELNRKGIGISFILPK